MPEWLLALALALSVAVALDPIDPPEMVNGSSSEWSTSKEDCKSIKHEVSDLVMYLI